MKFLFTLALGVAFVLGVSWWAQALQHVVQATIQPVGFCQLSGVSPAAGLSSCTNGIPTGAVQILAVVESANVRWRDDGTSPTASVGMPLTTSATLPWAYNGDLTKIKFIAVSGTPVLDIAFYAQGR